MGVKTLIENLKPLRADVSASYQRVLDKLQTGARSTDCVGALERWRNNVQTYLKELDQADLYMDDRALLTVRDEISTLTDRLDKGFDMDGPDVGLERWKIDRHFERLLTELETCCDLQAGYHAVRYVLLARDARLRWVMRRNDRVQPANELVAPVIQEVTA